MTDMVEKVARAILKENKPIPKDVSIMAAAICERFEPAYIAVARAIMEERERCAQIAAAAWHELNDDPTEFGRGYGRGYQHASANIASAIRNEGEGA